MANLNSILEAALFASGSSLTLDQMQGLFSEVEKPNKTQLKAALAALQQHYQNRGLELVEFSGKWRLQTTQAVAPYIANLWQEKPARYSRALLETLAIIAFKQPLTRSEIEDIRGVAVSSQIMHALLEREWVTIVGSKDVPGRPNLYATTNDFLAYFNLKSLADLPQSAALLAKFSQQTAMPTNEKTQSFEQLLANLKQNEAKQDAQFDELQQSLEHDFIELDQINAAAEELLHPTNEAESLMIASQNEDSQNELHQAAEPVTSPQLDALNDSQNAEPSANLPDDTNSQLSSEQKDAIIARMLAQQNAYLKPSK